MKRRYDDDDDDDYDDRRDERPAKRSGGGGKGGGSGGPGAMPCVLKLLAPEAMASAIIGKGGSVISSMRQSTGGRIGLTEHNEFFPGTDCRVLTAGCPDEESLTDLAMKIIDKVAECARDAPGDAMGDGNQVRLGTLLPRAAVGAIIGKGGHRVKELRESSGAKIAIEEASIKGPGANQVVTVIGSQGAVETVIGEFIRQLVDLNNEEWFESWATVPGAEKGSSGGSKGGSSKGGSGRKGGGGKDKDWDDRDYGHRESRDYGRDYARDSGPPPRSSRGKGGGHSSDPGSELLMRISNELPSYVKQDNRGFAMSCVVPNRLVGGLIGKSGVGTKEVQSTTDTKIAIREIPGDPENRSMNISGPLMNSCAAFMLMMKRYLDAEAQAQAAPPSDGRSRR